MIKYLYEVKSWAIQVSLLKPVYGDKNITVHITRHFSTTGDLFQDGEKKTSPLYFLLNERSIATLKEYLKSRYPGQKAETDTMFVEIESKVIEQEQVETPVTAEFQPVPGGKVFSEQSVKPLALSSEEIVQTILRELKPMMEGTAEEKPTVHPEVKKLRDRRFNRYNPDKSFEDEYNWVPSIFNALYFITSPIVAIVGALFFYTRIQSLWLFAAVSIAFIFLEMVFRRTIVRKCVSAMMRGRYLFGSVCLVIALGISAWSIIALWNGANQAEALKGNIFKSSPVESELASLSDSLSVWRAQQKELDGKWGVSLHISKDLSKRIAEGDKKLQTLQLQNDSQNHTGTAVWRYFFLLIELIVVLALILPVWYEGRGVLLQVEA